MSVNRRAHLADRELYRQFYDRDQRYGYVDLPSKDEPRLVWVLQSIGPNDDVIDIGCHKGELTYSIWSTTKGRVVGLDISPNSIEHARGLSATYSMDIEWQVGEAEHLPYPDDSFDVAVLTEILEHVPDPKEVLAEAERVVRHGGHIVISTPGNAEKMCQIEAPLRDASTGFALDMHVREYNPGIELAGKSGLKYGIQMVEGNERMKQGGLDNFVFHLARYTVRKGH